MTPHPSPAASDMNPAVVRADPADLDVRPDKQGRGTGTALLRAGHAALDEAGMPAYLEASGPRTRDLYLAHGYVLRPDAPFYLPEDGPPMWPMMRQPRRKPGAP